MYKAVREEDIHWTVSILTQNPELVANREKFYSALGLPLSELHDLNTNLSLRESGSDVFFRKTIIKWISREGPNATFSRLAQTSEDEAFKTTADAISSGVIKGGIKQLPAAVTKLPEWFDVPPPILMFTGRVKELEKLHEAIVGQNPEGTVITTLSGLGGIGKPVLSVEYAWRYQTNFYSSIIWLNSETITTLSDSFHRLAEHLGIDDSVGTKGYKLSLEKLSSRVYDSFNSSIRGTVLFIFDNAECYEDVKPYLPAVKPNTVKPFVLLTSRNRNWNRRVNLIVLDVFTEIESVDLLKNYFKLETEIELNIAREISNLLHNLPLGIRQAAAYIHEQSKVSGNLIADQMKEYLIEWNHNFKKAMTYEHWKQTDDQYEKTTFVTWNVTLDKVKKENTLSVRIMELTSYLNPENIPIELFRPLKISSIWSQGLKNLISWNTNTAGAGTVACLERSSLDHAIALLESYSLINRNETRHTFNVHRDRLVQKVIKVQVETKSSIKRLKEARHLIKVSLRGNTAINYEETCLIHASSVLSHLILSNFPSSKVTAFQVLVTQKQNKQISDQIHKLVKIFRTQGYLAMFDSFNEFDKTYDSVFDNLFFIENYYGTFLDFILQEVRTHCKFGSHIEIVRGIVKRSLPILNIPMLNVDQSVSPEILGLLISSLLLLSSAFQGNDEHIRFTLSEFILEIYISIIKNGRRKYFNAISRNSNNVFNVVKNFHEFGKIDIIVGFIQNINDMLNEKRYLEDEFVDSGLPNSLVVCRCVFNNHPLDRELILVELRCHEIMYERSKARALYNGMLRSLDHRLKCLAELDKYNEILEFISQFYFELENLITINGRDFNMANWFELSGQISKIAESPNCSGYFKTELFNEAFRIHKKVMSTFYGYMQLGPSI